MIPSTLPWGGRLVSEVTDWYFRVFLHSSHNGHHKLPFSSLADLFHVWLLGHQGFLSFFLWIFQIVVFAMYNASLLFLPASASKCLVLLPWTARWSSCWFILLNNKCSLHMWNPGLKASADIQSYLLFNQSIKQSNQSNRAHQETPTSHVYQKFLITWKMQGFKQKESPFGAV